MNLQKYWFGEKQISYPWIFQRLILFFRPRQKKINVNVLLVFENTVIKQVIEIRFLDIVIDHHLSWKPYISLVSKKISKSIIGIIAKACFYLSFKTLLSLYYSLVYPYLTYCNVAWSSTYCSNLNCIYLLQKRIAQLITKADYLSNMAPLFCQLRLCNIFSISSFWLPFSCIWITAIFCQLVFNVFSQLVNNFINTILEHPLNIDHIFVELILKKFVSFTRDLKSGILYQSQ